MLPLSFQLPPADLSGQNVLRTIPAALQKSAGKSPSALCGVLEAFPEQVSYHLSVKLYGLHMIDFNLVQRVRGDMFRCLLEVTDSACISVKLQLLRVYPFCFDRSRSFPRAVCFCSPSYYTSCVSHLSERLLHMSRLSFALSAHIV